MELVHITFWWSIAINNSMKKNILQNRGISILGFLVLGFILVLVLSYYNISIRSVVESPTGQDNINYVQDTSKSVWDKYLKSPVSYLWNDVWINLFWKSFISNLERIRDGQPTDLDLAAPRLNYNNVNNTIDVGNSSSTF